jgi:4-hydroxy-4-methyl-2-oxoglutarate aldolase
MPEPRFLSIWSIPSPTALLVPGEIMTCFFSDDDGVIFAASTRIERMLDAAETIWKVERRQAEKIQAGKKLSEQLDFDLYLEKRNSDLSYTLHRHLRERGRAVEE